MDWYYKTEGGKFGPFTEKQIKELEAKGTVTAETMVWNEFISRWRPYGELGDIQSPQPSVPRLAPALKTPPAAAAPVTPAPAPAPAPASAGPADKPWDPFDYIDTPQAQAETATETKAEPSEPRQRCTECGTEHPEGDLLQYGNERICAACKPLYFQRLKEGIDASGRYSYAGFWVRFWAKIIDGLIYLVIYMVLVFAPQMLFVFSDRIPTSVDFILMQLLNIVGYVVYCAFCVFFVGRYGATPGKMALGLKIIMPDGDRVTYLRALGRFFAEILSGLTLYIGYIIAAFDDEKRSLHDRICNTRVVRTGPKAA